MEEKTMSADFWNDQEQAQKTLRDIKQISHKVEIFEKLVADYDDASTLIQMADEENDDSLINEVQELVEKFIEDYDNFYYSMLLSDEHDKSNAIVTLHSGAGGTEACDWVEMLLRMYMKWAEKHGYSTEIVDYLAGEEAGIKSVTFEVCGENAFGYLKGERGIHRLVRISPFNAAGKRQTSFASFDVLPEMDEDITVDIDAEDLRIDTYRSSGAGGQHVNKTESAIRITHIPTGIVVQCQNERSQHKNKDMAMKVLKAKLYNLKQSEQVEKISDFRGEIKEIGWSSQIRSYVFQPYSMVKDHRTQAETGNVQAVMDGGIDLFINAYLLASRNFKKDLQE